MRTRISFDLDTDQLQSCTDQYLAALWHISQATIAPFGDPKICEVSECIAREIVRRFLARTPPELWCHRASHIEAARHMPAAGQEGGAA